MTEINWLFGVAVIDRELCKELESYDRRISLITTFIEGENVWHVQTVPVKSAESLSPKE